MSMLLQDTPPAAQGVQLDRIGYRQALEAFRALIPLFPLQLLLLLPAWWLLAHHPGVGAWLATAFGMQLLTLVLFLLYRRAPSQRRRQASWQRWLLAFSTLHALSWGLGPGLLLFPAAEPPLQLPLLFLLVGVALSTIALHNRCVWGGILPIAAVIAPTALSCLNQGEAPYYLLSLILVAYGVALVWIQRRRNLDTLQLLQLDRDNGALRREGETYKTLYENAQHLAELSSWELDMRNGELRWSDEAYEMFGIQPGEALTKEAVQARLYWSDRQPFFRALQDSLLGARTLNREFRLVNPDGSLRVLQDTGEMLHDEEGRPLRMLGVMRDVTGRVSAENKTRNAYDELNRILTHMQDTYYRADPAGRLSQVSSSMERLLGYRPEECVSMRIADLYAVRRHGQTFLQDLHLQSGLLHNYEIQMQHRHGQRVWVSVNAQFIRDTQEHNIGIEGTIRDITELKQARAALQQEKERALVTLHSIGDGVITTDEEGLVQYLNPTAERLLGMDNASVQGIHYRQVLPLVDEGNKVLTRDLVQLCLSLEGEGVHVDEGELIKEEGSRFHLKVTAAPMRDSYGHVVGAVLVLHDITEVMGMARQLSYQANHDMLTGLYNRNVFEQRLEEAIRQAQTHDVTHMLFYLDLDQFKVVNDTCGHHAGDELLQQVAGLMLKRVRETDVLARLGGDEFGVLLEYCPLEKAERIAEAIRHEIHDYRFAWDDKVFEIGVSIGVVPINAESGNLTQVLAAADAACYIAKDSGRNRIHLYQPDDDAVLQRRGEMQWVHRLSSAFDDQRFLLYAQPIAHLAGEDRVISHYEILIRMQDESGRIIPPGAFIPAAERYNLMPMIDRWVIRNTLEMMRDAQGELAFPPVECAINLSGASLCDDHLLEYVVDLFDETGIPCECISFEVTETAAVANLSRATRFISVLRGMGCSFSLDDFGAGLSSFGYLKTLPVDNLKIDGGFVRDMVRDKVDRAMVESINEIGHIMGLKTIAEYAEDEAILEALEMCGVDYAQGHAIGGPLSFAEVLERETRLTHKSAIRAEMG